MTPAFSSSAGWAASSFAGSATLGRCAPTPAPPSYHTPLTRHARPTPSAKLSGLIFDCDGVLAESERDGHRQAFNITFAERGFDAEWDPVLYKKLLGIGGGKERMHWYWNEKGAWPTGYDTPDKRDALVRELHARKTDLFIKLVESGSVPLRVGVERLVNEALETGVPLAVCSTSNEKAVTKIVELLGDKIAAKIPVFAGDCVDNKKPSPDVFFLAKEKLGLDPKNVCVLEDSHNGLVAAKAAGMACVVTKSAFTYDEDFSMADKVLESLDNPKVTLKDLEDIVQAANFAPTV